MLKYQKWLVSFVIALLAWLALIKISTDVLVDPRISQIVFVLPMYALVTFGAYSLAVIAMSVMAVTDCPDAAKELDQQVVEAKADLRKKGMQL
ncbi:hypothetical protein PINS_up010963 [Pythium insidiosum]|nr:hypothetical protein PINS_up010963 [Pythium insidiosum]